MRILGINAGHDGSVCLLDDGKVEFAIDEERLNRQKGYFGWPYMALDLIVPGPVHVALANSDGYWHQMQRRDARFTFRRRNLSADPVNVRSLSHDFGSRRPLNASEWATGSLQQRGFKVLSLSCYDHHLSHAASAYFTSGRETALAFTADGSGDHRSASAYLMRRGDFSLISETRLPHSPGHMYAWMTRYLGFRANRHEGKLTGLSARGNPRNLVINHQDLLRYDPASRSLVNPYIANYLGSSSLPGLYSKLTRSTIQSLVRRETQHLTYLAFEEMLAQVSNAGTREDLAALAQQALERSILNWVQALVTQHEIGDVVLAGGVFANVLLNQKISELECVNSTWVFPNMGDGGLSVGAAFLRFAEGDPIQESQPQAIEDVYWGPSITCEEIEAACMEFGVACTRLSNPHATAAQLIAEGRIVAWVRGRLEFGPRALGHRSLLARPDLKEANETINGRLGRSEFMPFAPSVLSEWAAEIFPGLTSADYQNARFMTTTLNVSESWTDKLRSVVHVDGTARPQLVDKRVEPDYWKLISTFHGLTGIPAVINTSYNMHEEPIVCTARDAIRSFVRGAADVLFINDLQITR